MKIKNKIIQLASQQGDIPLEKLDRMPVGEKKIISRGRCVLAHGESGHSHVVEQDDAELIQIGERMLLRISKEADVTHEEHKTQTLSPGVWEIGRVSEYDYFSKMVRKVQD